jgi:hypothetical protein
MMDVQEEMTDTPEMQQQDNGWSPKTAVMSTKQEDAPWSPQPDPRAGDREVNSQVFCQEVSRHCEGAGHYPSECRDY